MATREILNGNEVCVEDAAITTAAIEGIDVRLSELGARLLEVSGTISYHSQYAPGDLPDSIAEGSADRLEAAYAEEEALGQEIDVLEEIQEEVARGAADGDIVMYYAQETADRPAVPQPTVEDL